MTDGEKKV